MIKDKIYTIRTGGRNVPRLRALGYNIQRRESIDLPPHVLIAIRSSQSIECICDACSKEFSRDAWMIADFPCGGDMCKRCANQSRVPGYLYVGKSKDEIREIKETALYGEVGLDKTEKARRTKENKYGDPNYCNVEKIAATKLERYGEDLSIFADAIKSTKLERYGDPNFCNTEKIAATKLERYGDPNYNNPEKNKETCLERYGVDSFRKYEPFKDWLREFNAQYRQSEEYHIMREDLRRSKGWGEFREDVECFEKYRIECWIETNKNDLTALPNYDKRGLAGTDGVYQLDHRISIHYGYLSGISPQIIGNINNLEMLPWRENLSKHNKCSITIDELNGLIESKELHK